VVYVYLQMLVQNGSVKAIT